MRIGIYSVGRLKNCPEKEIFDRYFDRSRSLGGYSGFTNLHDYEIDPRNYSNKTSQYKQFLQIIPKASYKIILDETGRELSSIEFSALLKKLRMSYAGTEIAFLIGGAEGHDQRLKQVGDQALTFGCMTWPHKMVRVMLMEQIYRAFTYLKGMPYHKD